MSNLPGDARGMYRPAEGLVRPRIPDDCGLDEMKNVSPARPSNSPTGTSGSFCKVELIGD
jgi:hypothetical protein